jgi:hypothetical protein
MGFPWPLIPGNNLADLPSVAAALQNLALGSYDNPPLGATPTIDWTRGTTQTATLDANCTLTFIAPNKPGPLRLFLTEDATGNHTIALPGNGIWVQGVPPYPMAATLKRELQIDYDGSTYWVWYSPSSGDNYLSIVTATSTTALTASSPPIVELTGTATHQVYLPDIGTLYKGWSVNLFNSSTGNVLLRSFDGSLITTLLATGGHFHVVCRATTGSQPVAWLIGKVSLSAGVVGTLGTANGGTGVDNSTGGTANTFWARPNGATGAATYRAIVAADVPDLSAAYLSLSAGGTVAGQILLGSNLLPAVDNTTSLGTVGQAFNALYLSAASQINFNDGDALIDFAANILTLSATDVRLGSTAGTNTASVVTVGGAQDLTGKTYNGLFIGSINVVTPSTTPTVNFSANPNQSLALSGNTTFTFTDPTIAGYVAIKNSDAVGGRTRTWPGNVTWVSGRAPRTLSAGETQIVFGWFDGATHWMDYTPSAKDRVTITSTTTNADADITTSTAEFHFDDTAGATGVVVDGKDSGGTVTHQYLIGNTYRIVIAGPTASRTYTLPDANATLARKDAAETFNGPVTIADATTPSLTTAAGKTNTGFVQINGKTSGSLKITAADATAQAVTVTTAAQTSGAATVTIPDQAGTNRNFVTSASAGTAGQVLKATGSGSIGTYSDDIGTVGITIDGGGSAITTGVKGYVNCPFAGTIVQATLVTDQTGSIVVDVYKAAFSTSVLPSSSICASAKPTVSSAKGSQDSTLTGWTTSVSAKDTFGFNVDSATTVTKATLTLKIRKS